MLDTLRLLRKGRSLVSTENQWVRRDIVTDVRIKVLVEEFFSSWHQKWDKPLASRVYLPTLSGSLHSSSYVVSPINCDMPPYIKVIVQHTRLSVYTALLGNVEDGLDTSVMLWNAGLEAACGGVMDAAVKHEEWLRAIVSRRVRTNADKG